MLSSSCAIAGPSNASTAVDSCEARLHTALSSGALTREEYETKMKQHRQPNAPTSVATRVYGETVVAKYNWLPAAGPFETKKLAIEGARVFEHGRWKYGRKGDKKLLVCNAHVDCQVKLLGSGTRLRLNMRALSGNIRRNIRVDIAP